MLSVSSQLVAMYILSANASSVQAMRAVHSTKNAVMSGMCSCIALVVHVVNLDVHSLQQAAAVFTAWAGNTLGNRGFARTGVISARACIVASCLHEHRCCTSVV